MDENTKELIAIGASLAAHCQPCIKFHIEKVLCDYNIIFAGYTDACAYIVTDEMLDESGYEVNCFLEYMHKGPIKKGIDNLILTAFESALSQLS